MKTKLIFAAVFAASLSMAQSKGPLLVDLTTGSIFDLGTTTPTKAANTYTMPYATVVTTNVKTCPETPYQARIDVNLAGTNGVAAAKRLRLTVQYDGPSTREPKLPTGWVTHIGDDPQNDGFGGGTSLVSVAEAHVTDQNLAVYSSAVNPGEVDRVAYQELRLAKGALQFDVANEYFSWSQPFNEIDATNGKKLFQIGTNGADSKLYVGLNRVVRDGSTRIGCGAKRALLEFVP